MEQYKTCINCNATLPFAAFYKDKAKKQGLSTYCKDCSKSKAQSWRKQNPDRHLEHALSWQKEHPERVYQKNKKWRLSNPDKMSKYQRKWLDGNKEAEQNRGLRRRACLKNSKIYKVNKNDIRHLLARPCFYCGKPSTTIDHIIPISRGGLHSVGNLIGACLSCNSSKRHLFITEWKKVRGW